MKQRIRVWDLPTRLFHWSLVLLIVFSFVSVKVGGNWMRWHFYSGYCILALISFRVVWGFFGGRYARFRSFLFSPRQILDYVKGVPGAVKTLGHNPLGSLSVFGLLAVVALQAVTGLFSNDDIAEEGPLVKFVSNATSNLITSIHHWNEKLIIALVLAHIGAVLFYLLGKRENLIKPMLSGDKETEDDGPPCRDDWSLRLRALVFLVICASLVAVVVNWPAKGG